MNTLQKKYQVTSLFCFLSLAFSLTYAAPEALTGNWTVTPGSPPTPNQSNSPITKCPMQSPASGTIISESSGVLQQQVTQFGVGLLLGQGDGQFQRKPIFQTYLSTDTVGFDTVKLNQDNVPDLIWIINHKSQPYLGNGDGSFRPADTKLTAPVIYNQKSVKDLNNDQRDDLIYLSGNAEGAADIVTYLNQGNGTFSATPIITHTETAISNIAFTHVNDDTFLDIVAFDLDSDTVITLTGVGDGLFNPPIIESVGFNAIQGIFGDFNGDQRLDIVLSIDNCAEFISYITQTDGSYQHFVSVTTAKGPVFLTQDINTDGLDDLVVTSFHNSNLLKFEIMLADNKSLFTSASIQNRSGYVSDVKDINSDGVADIIIREKNQLIAHHLRNDGSTINISTLITFPSPSDLRVQSLLDLNGDNRLDVYGFSRLNKALFVSISDVNGIFQDWVKTPLSGLIGINNAGDINNDGHIDFFYTTDQPDLYNEVTTFVSLPTEVQPSEPIKSEGILDSVAVQPSDSNRGNTVLETDTSKANEAQPIFNKFAANAEANKSSTLSGSDGDSDQSLKNSDGDARIGALNIPIIFTLFMLLVISGYRNSRKIG